jgi:hypothetical protein
MAARGDVRQEEGADAEVLLQQVDDRRGAGPQGERLRLLRGDDRVRCELQPDRRAGVTPQAAQDP